MLLAGKDENIAEERQGQSHIEGFEGELLNFSAKGGGEVLEVLKAQRSDD